MPSQTGSERAGPREPVEQLVELARSACEDSVPQVLEAVADAVSETCAYQSLAVNIYRPAWDDYEVVLVRGAEDIHRALFGTRMTAAEFRLLIGAQRPRLPGTFFLDAASTGWGEVEHVFTPAIAHRNRPDAWQAEDGVVVALSDANGAPLGFLSADEPRSGRRPSDDDLRLLRAICSHAEQALKSAQHHEEAGRTAELNTRMLRASGQIAACATEPELVAVVCDVVEQQLGFERVAIYLSGPTDSLVLALSRGWEPSDELAERISDALLRRAMDPAREHAGSWLVPARELFELDDGQVRSRRNGAGAHGWDEGCLLVPINDGAGELAGVLVAEDPVDHRLPSDQVRNLLRLLADQASAALTSLTMRGIQHRLLDLVLVREGPQALADALAGTINAPVMLLDWSGEPLADAAHESRRIGIPDLHRLQATSGDGEQGAVIVRPLEIGEHVEGYLVVDGSDGPDPVRELAVEQAVTSFALQLMVLSNAEEAERRARGSLIDELLDSSTVNIDALTRRARRLGHDLGGLSYAIAVEPADEPEGFAERSDFLYLARAVRTVLDDAECRSLIAPRAASILALISDPPVVDRRSIGTRLIQEALERTGVRTVVGISRPIGDAAGLTVAIREAQEALKAARALPRLDAVALAGELPLHDLLLATPYNDEIVRAAQRILAPLTEYGDRLGGPDLLRTLVAYLDAIGNHELIAESLQVHINTVRYRIKRIEELLGRQLRDAQTRFDLQMALQVLARV
jgi:sugar diacid utilization regulator/GAF domain-containing protein